MWKSRDDHARAACALLALLWTVSHPAQAVRANLRSESALVGKEDTSDIGAQPIQHSQLPVCDPSVVAETCAFLNGHTDRKTGETVSHEVLSQVLSAPTETIRSVFEGFGLHVPEGEGVPCQKLCSYLAHKLGEDMVMPQFTDQGCYRASDAVKCDIVLTPQDLMQLATKKDRDLPDMHDEDVSEDVVVDESALHAKQAQEFNASHLSDENPQDGTDKEAHRKMELHEYDHQLGERTLNLFRIFPASKLPDEDNRTQSSLAEGMKNDTNASKPLESIERASVIGRKSVMYLNNVVRRVQAHDTRKHIMNWFGSDAYDNENTRHRVLDTLNSAITVLNNAEWLYPGRVCGRRTYAYVYRKEEDCSFRSQARYKRCTKIADKFAIYLCPLFMEVTDMEKIEVLVHEASHHAVAYTEDYCMSDCQNRSKAQLAYGRRTCRHLAEDEPAAALINADNFCYYVSDVNGEVPCHASALKSTPDGDGDCKCDHNKNLVCHSSSSQRGCYSSRGNKDALYFYPGCRTCQCIRSEVAPGVEVVTPAPVFANATETCPEFAISRTPDSGNDCQCQSGLVCQEAGKLGCRANDLSTRSQRWFRSECSNCKCVSEENEEDEEEATATTEEPIPPSAIVSTATCPSFARSASSDSGGDCDCPAGLACHENGRPGCRANGLSTPSQRWFRSGCETCKCLQGYHVEAQAQRASQGKSLYGSVAEFAFMCCSILCCAYIGTLCCGGSSSSPQSSASFLSSA
eukprot:TRINITY_DN33273_c0_g1_i2.p1 TRINITY_DN33273_c0_g1~~TRINITY_DN33273_c0_g1_i2.p1  ORF type:complete len:745 (+),score=70.75 TRINITY_DN33273_c0_g1_i2:85-2319(+)